ncbi:hypothetical protein ACHQM5_018020 [Ranunculus cassubicifolius]
MARLTSIEQVCLLLEIVSEPDMRTGLEAAEYTSEIQRLVRFLGVSNGNMQEGSLRCDVNLSVRPVAQSEFGTKAEIKNLNSFLAMHITIDYEISRQVLLHSEGQVDQIVQETRLWEEGAQRTSTMTKKEGLADYRYFPEPDLPQVVLTTEYIDTIRKSLPELPESKRRRYEKMGLNMQDVLFLANDINVCKFFDTAIEKGADVKMAANWIMELIASIKGGVISGKIGNEILFELITKGGTVKAVIEEKDLVQIVDPNEIERMVDTVIKENPKQHEQYRGGKTKLQGFFAGHVDHSTIETFAQNGRTCVSYRVYPTTAIHGAARLFLFNNATETGVTVTSLKVMGEFAAASLKSVDWSLVVKFWLRRINKCTIATYYGPILKLSILHPKVVYRIVDSPC